jgi:chromosome segregation ATPase
MTDEESLLNMHKIVLQLAKEIQPVIQNPMEISSQELALNLQILLKAKGPLNSQDAESYRELILGLNEKLKVLQIQYQELEYYKKLANDLTRQIESSEKKHKMIVDQMDQLRKIQQKQAETLADDKKKLIGQLAETRNLLENSKLCEEELNIELENTRNQLGLAKDENLRLRKSAEKGASSGGDDFDQKFKNMKNALQENLEKIGEFQEKLKNEMEAADMENRRLKEKIEEQNGIIFKLNNENDGLLNDNSNLKAEIVRQENELKALDELESQNKALRNNSENLKSQNEHYNNTIKNLTADNRNLASELIGLKEKTNSQIQSMNNKLLNQETSLKLLSNKNKDLENELSSQVNQSNLLSKRLASSNDSMKSAYEEISKYQDNLFEKQKKTESELEFIANYTLKTSQDHLDQERKLKKLGDIINERDSELSILREMIGELQKPKPSYNAIKDDYVDQALAEYLNSRPEPMEVNFIREDTGTYLFGSKRVFIKIENGKIISKE